MGADSTCGLVVVSIHYQCSVEIANLAPTRLDSWQTPGTAVLHCNGTHFPRKALAMVFTTKHVVYSALVCVQLPGNSVKSPRTVTT